MPAPPKSDDLVPRNTIWLSDAFERYYRATAPDGSAVEAELNAALPRPESLWMWRCSSNWLGCLTGADYEKAAWEPWYRAHVAREESRSRAEKSFRDELASGRLIALVRDPATGETLQLDYRRWNERMNFGVAGFTEEFVGPDDLSQPGPCTIVGGAMRPVFFDLDEFQSWLLTLPGRRSCGQKPRHDPQPSEPVEIAERWPIPEKEPTASRRAAAWRLAKRVWGKDGGPIKGPSWRALTDKLNKQRIDGEEIVSEDTLRRVFLACNRRSANSANSAD
jgi:hypothetical protein